jgi:hypothetical protein
MGIGGRDVKPHPSRKCIILFIEARPHGAVWLDTACTLFEKSAVHND